MGGGVEYPVEQGGEHLGAFIVQRVYLPVQIIEKFLKVNKLLLFSLKGFFQLLAGIQSFVPLHQGWFRQVGRVDFLQGFRQFFYAFYFLAQPFLLFLEVR